MLTGIRVIEMLLPVDGSRGLRAVAGLVPGNVAAQVVPLAPVPVAPAK